jgi:hypothetical protein
MEETEDDGSSLIAIHKDRFHKLVTGLRTAVANEYISILTGMGKRFAYAISSLACLLLLIPSGSFVANLKLFEKAYAQFIERDLSSIGEVEVITENNKKFKFGRDFEVELVEDEDIFKDNDAKKADNMKFKRGETVVVELPRPSEEADSVSPTFCLADKDKSENRIAKDEGRCGPDGIDFEVEI